MNEALQNFARTSLKEGLAQCTEDQQHVFRLMYSPNDLDRCMEDVVDRMPEGRLDWAMQQVEYTLAGLGNSSGDWWRAVTGEEPARHPAPSPSTEGGSDEA